MLHNGLTTHAKVLKVLRLYFFFFYLHLRPHLSFCQMWIPSLLLSSSVVIVALALVILWSLSTRWDLNRQLPAHSESLFPTPPPPPLRPVVFLPRSASSSPQAFCCVCFFEEPGIIGSEIRRHYRSDRCCQADFTFLAAALYLYTLSSLASCLSR